MHNYKKMYSILFNQTTEVIEELKKAQQDAEEIYINSENMPLHIITDKAKPHNK